jgi:hypothetical protein
MSPWVVSYFLRKAPPPLLRTVSLRIRVQSTVNYRSFLRSALILKISLYSDPETVDLWSIICHHLTLRPYMLRDQPISRPVALSHSKCMIGNERNRAKGNNIEDYRPLYVEHMCTVRKSNRPDLV